MYLGGYICCYPCVIQHVCTLLGVDNCDTICFGGSFWWNTIKINHRNMFVLYLVWIVVTLFALADLFGGTPLFFIGILTGICVTIHTLEHESYFMPWWAHLFLTISYPQLQPIVAPLEMHMYWMLHNKCIKNITS